MNESRMSQVISFYTFLSALRSFATLIELSTFLFSNEFLSFLYTSSEKIQNLAQNLQIFLSRI